MSWIMVFEKPAAKFPIINIDIATMSITFLPKISLNLPYNGWKQVDVSKYADGTHDTTEPALNAVEIVGRAVATVTESSVLTTMHMLRPRKVPSTFLKGRRLVWSVSWTSSRFDFSCGGAF